MDLSRLMERLKKDEGFSPKAFWDHDQWTVGYGCKAVDSHEEVTEEEAHARLADRVTVAAHDCTILFPAFDTFGDVREEALANMVFNLGRSKLGRFYRMCNAINGPIPDWSKAAMEAFDSKWRVQVGDRALRIIEELRTGEREGE